MSMPMSSGDSGSGDAHFGVNLPGGVGGASGQVTVGHSVLCIVLALVALWFLGGVAFKSVRM